MPVCEFKSSDFLRRKMNASLFLEGRLVFLLRPVYFFEIWEPSSQLETSRKVRKGNEMNGNTIYIPTSSSSGYCFFCKGWWIWTNQLRCIDYRPPRFLLTTVDGSEILLSPVEVGSLSYDTGFIHPRWFRIPSVNSRVYWQQIYSVGPLTVVMFSWLQLGVQ